MVGSKGNLPFVFTDAEVARCVLHYLESVVIQSVDESALDDRKSTLRRYAPQLPIQSRTVVSILD